LEFINIMFAILTICIENDTVNRSINFANISALFSNYFTDGNIRRILIYLFSLFFHIVYEDASQTNGMSYLILIIYKTI